MKNINRQIGASVNKTTRPSKIFKNTDGFLNVDAGYVYSPISLTNMVIIDANKLWQTKVMSKVNELK